MNNVIRQQQARVEVQQTSGHAPGELLVVFKRVLVCIVTEETGHAPSEPSEKPARISRDKRNLAGANPAL